MYYMIHTCLDREWYVTNYLVPSLLEQGIPNEEIKIWLDESFEGNLYACMNSFADCGKRSGSTWHLQDDVVISKDFYEITKKQDPSIIICGFVGKDVGPNIEKDGIVPYYKMWWSFQCIQIPNKIAGDCARWFFEDYQYRNVHGIQAKIQSRKNDDWFFNRFLREHHPYDDVLNLKPNLVDHIDNLLGGSIVNKERTRNHTSPYFDKQIVEDLEKKLKEDGRLKS